MIPPKDVAMNAPLHKIALAFSLVGGLLSCAEVGQDNSTNALGTSRPIDQADSGAPSGFNFSSYSDPNACLAPQDGNIVDGTPVVAKRCTFDASQAWTAQLGRGTLTLGNLCLTAVEGTTPSGSGSLALKACNTSDPKQFWTTQASGGSWRNSDRCWQIGSDKVQDIYRVSLARCNTANTQQRWTAVAAAVPKNSNMPSNGLVQNANGEQAADGNSKTPLTGDSNIDPVSLPLSGYLASKIDGMMCLDRPVGAVDGQGAGIVQLYACNGTGPQTFTATVDKLLQAASGDMCLGVVTMRSTDRGATNVALEKCDSGKAAHLWDYANGTWRNRSTGMCLDISLGFPAAFGRLYAKPCTSAVSQQWSQITNHAVKHPDPLLGQTTVVGRCSPQVLFGNLGSDANARLVTSRLPNLAADVLKAAPEVCNVMFSKAQSVPARTSTINVSISYEANLPAAYVMDHTITIGGQYLLDKINQNDLQDIQGMLRHELTHFYQRNSVGAPGWLIEGMAEVVRFKTGYVNATETKGKPYTDGYAVVAFFLFYLEKSYSGFFQQLAIDIQRTDAPWSLDYFSQKTGKTFDTLWQQYQATL